MVLALDLSLSSTGWAKFSKDGKLIDKGKIIPSDSLDNHFKMVYLADTIKGMIHNCDELVIEDIFLGKNFFGIKELARLSGAVIYMWITNKFKLPTFYMASTARKNAGIKSTSQKAETQLFILDKYGFASKDKLKEYSSKISEVLSIKEKGKRKYQLEKVSNLIEKETGYGNDLCDAIILGLAYFNKHRGLFE
jgi:crossover junction endodeoxyribonuclease RuvC